jgi:hypothetical protein
MKIRNYWGPVVKIEELREGIVKIIRANFDCGTLTYQGEAHEIADSILDYLGEQGVGVMVEMTTTNIAPDGTILEGFKYKVFQQLKEELEGKEWN